MRHEVFTGAERRRRWSVEEELAIIEEVGINGWTVSGGTMWDGRTSTTGGAS